MSYAPFAHSRAPVRPNGDPRRSLPRRALLLVALGLAVGCAGDAPPDDSRPSSDPTLGAIQVETLEDLGWGNYSLTTWELGQTLDPPLRTKDGAAPRVHLFGPADPPPGPPRPTLLWLHGGSLDKDSEANPTGIIGYCADEHAHMTIQDAINASPLLVFAAMRGWVVVMPENTVCDGWAGEGEDDPVDTSHHGAVLARAAMALGQSGQLPWEPGPRFIAGTSLGAPAAVQMAISGEFAGLVVDSGAADEVCFFADDQCSPLALTTRQAWGDHVFGGLPTLEGGGADTAIPTTSPQQDRYLQRSLVPMLQAGALSGPVVHIWSSEDNISIPNQHEGVEEAMRAALPEGSWVSLDLATLAHSFLHRGPAPGAAWVTLRTFEGAQVTSFELEAYDDEAWVGETQLRGLGQPDSSGGAVRRSMPAEGAGTLLIVEGLPECPAGEPIEWLLLVRGAGSDEERIVARVSVEQGGAPHFTQELTAADLSTATTDNGPLRRWLELGSGGFISQGGEGRLVIEVTGYAEVRADVLYWSCG
jgi:hypothetical protein